MLTRTSEYALRALVYLTQNADEGPVTSGQIAEAQEIPRRYLSAVLRELVRSGILVATPGTSGGFSLARDPSEITLFDAVSRLELNLTESATCPFGNIECNDRHPCAGHDRWTQLKQQIQGFLHGTTLFDVAMVRPKQRAKRRSAKSRR